MIAAQDKQLIRDIIEGATHRLGKVSIRKARTYILIHRCGESWDVQMRLDQLVDVSNATVFRNKAKKILEEL